MIRKLLVVLVLVPLGLLFAPGGMELVEDLLGLGEPITAGDLGSGDNGEKQLPPSVAAADPRKQPAPGKEEQGPAVASNTAAEPELLELPSIDGGSVLGVLSRIQAHADRVGIACRTIESTNGPGASEGDSVDLPDAARWKLTGDGEPARLLAFLAALERDDDLTALDRVSLLPRDAQTLAFDVRLLIQAPAGGAN